MQSRCSICSRQKHLQANKRSSGAWLSCVFRGACPTNQSILLKILPNFVLPPSAVWQPLVMTFAISVELDSRLFQHLDASSVVWETSRGLTLWLVLFLLHLAESRYLMVQYFKLILGRTMHCNELGCIFKILTRRATNWLWFFFLKKIISFLPPFLFSFGGGWLPMLCFRAI